MPLIPCASIGEGHRRQSGCGSYGAINRRVCHVIASNGFKGQRRSELVVFFTRQEVLMGPRLVRDGYGRQPYGNTQKILSVSYVQNMYNSVVELYFSGISRHKKRL